MASAFGSLLHASAGLRALLGPPSGSPITTSVSLMSHQAWGRGGGGSKELTGESDPSWENIPLSHEKLLFSQGGE